MKRIPLLCTLLFLVGACGSPAQKTQTTLPDSLPSLDEKRSLFDHLAAQQNPSIELVADFQQLIADKFQQEYRSAALFCYDDAGEVILDGIIELRTRGKFRCRYCEHTPIKLKIPKKQLKAAEMHKHNEIKLVFPCKPGWEYKDYVLREYLCYRLYNLLSPYSYRVKRVDFLLRDSANLKYAQKLSGFIIEDKEELAKRQNAKKTSFDFIDPDTLDPQIYLRLQLFQYLIGNTDWCTTTTHNLEPLLLKSGVIVPVPYDFDFSGMVNAAYATPNSTLPIESVRQRFFLGRYASYEELKPTLDFFREKKAALFEEVAAADYLSRSSRKALRKYMEKFYEVIESPERVEEHLLGKPADLLYAY